MVHVNQVPCCWPSNTCHRFMGAHLVSQWAKYIVTYIPYRIQNKVIELTESPPNGASEFALLLAVPFLCPCCHLQ